MRRRELLAGGVSLGLALVNDALVEQAAAAAGNPDTPRFFQGLLSGGPIAFTGFGATNRDRTDGYGFSNNDFAGCLCAIPTAASGQATGDLSGFSLSTTYLGSDLVLNLQRAR
jgi:hypothetical protein